MEAGFAEIRCLCCSLINTAWIDTIDIASIEINVTFHFLVLLHLFLNEFIGSNTLASPDH